MCVGSHNLVFLVSEELFIVERGCNRIWSKPKEGCVSRQNIIKHFAGRQELGTSTVKDAQGTLCFCLQPNICNDVPWEYTSQVVRDRYNNLILAFKDAQDVDDQDNITMTDWATMNPTTAYYHYESSMAMDNSARNRSATTQTLEFTMLGIVAIFALIIQFK